MTFTMLVHLFSALLDFLSLFARSEQEKDLEILLLRQQVRILQRTRTRPPPLSGGRKCPWPYWLANWSKGPGTPVLGSARACSCSRLKPCCGGIGSSCATSGPFNASHLQAGRGSRWNSKRSSYDWPERTRVGAMANSRANCSNSVIGWDARPFETF